MSKRPEDLRVAFLSLTDPRKTSRMHMPYSMARALESRVREVVTFSPEGGSGMGPVPRPITEWPLIGRVARKLSKRFLTFDGSIRALERRAPGYAYSRTLRKARRMSKRLAAEVARHDVDVVFACIVTWPLFEFPLHRPTVFYTDATTAVVNSSFPGLASRSPGFKQACAEIESDVYARASAVGVSAHKILESAEVDHGLDPNKGHVIYMGANVTPDEPLRDVSGLDLPTKEDLRLLIVSSDPQRKRLDLAVEVAEMLRDRGWGATLQVVGRSTPRADASGCVRFIGARSRLLQLSIPEDLARMKRAFADAHVFLLPSTAEGAPISPTEAAHFGRPSVVSDVAGLPSVVEDGETGRVLPVELGARSYVDAIEDLVSDAGRYRQFCANALARAQGEFTWEAWAERIADLLARATRSRSA